MKYIGFRITNIWVKDHQVVYGRFLLGQRATDYCWELIMGDEHMTTFFERCARFDGVEEVRAAILDIYMTDEYFADKKCIEFYEKISARLREIRHTILVEMDEELVKLSKQA